MCSYKNPQFLSTQVSTFFVIMITEIMVNYLFFTTGGQVDNDPSVLLQNEKEIIKVCDLILEGCDVENYRLEAITYKAKVLYAKRWWTRCFRTTK